MRVFLTVILALIVVIAMVEAEAKPTYWYGGREGGYETRPRWTAREGGYETRARWVAREAGWGRETGWAREGGGWRRPVYVTYGSSEEYGK